VQSGRGCQEEEDGGNLNLHRVGSREINPAGRRLKKEGRKAGGYEKKDGVSGIPRKTRPKRRLLRLKERNGGDRRGSGGILEEHGKLRRERVYTAGQALGKFLGRTKMTEIFRKTKIQACEGRGRARGGGEVRRQARCGGTRARRRSGNVCRVAHLRGRVIGRDRMGKRGRKTRIAWDCDL